MMQCSILLVILIIHRFNGQSDLNEISLMSYNVMLLPSILVFQRDQQTRAKLLTKAKFLRQTDILCLQEVFQFEPSAILLDALEKTYPYSTPILGDESDKEHWNETWNHEIGRHSLKFVSGGVTILSKWPIVYAVQYFYQHACSAHTFVRTGFVYSQIIYGRKKYKIHVFGTHLQPNDHRGCYLDGEDKIREEQMIELKDFIDSRKIPDHELIFILGDFNIDKYHRKQYETMLKILNVYPQVLHRSSVPFSWDSVYNAMAKARHGDQLLDYVFLLRRSPSNDSLWLNLITDRMASEQWHLLGQNHSFYDSRNMPLMELSDHYPVIGFFQKNNRSWFRRTSGVITYIELYTVDTNLPVIIVERELVLGKSSNQTASQLILSNNGTPRRHRCLRSDQYVLLIDRQRPELYLSNEKQLEIKFGKEHANRYLKIIRTKSNSSEKCIGTNSTVIFQMRFSTGFSYVRTHHAHLCACARAKEDAQLFRIVEIERHDVHWKRNSHH